MKSLFTLLCCIILSFSAYSRSVNDYVDFEYSRGEIYATKNTTIRENVTLYVYQSSRLISSIRLSSTPELLRMDTREPIEFVVELTDISIPDGGEPATTRIGPATLDEIDLIIKNMDEHSAYEFMEKFCNESINFEVKINGVLIDRQCYCNFLMNLIQYNITDPFSTYFNTPYQSQWIGYSQEYQIQVLGQHISDYCDKYSGGGTHSSKMANPQTIETMLNTQSAFIVSTINGQELNCKTLDELKQLQSGVYIIKQTALNDIVVIKYIVP